MNIYIHKETGAQMFIAVWFIGKKTDEETAVHPCDELLLSNEKEWSSYACKMWVNLKFMLSERSKIQKSIYYKIPFIRRFRSGNTELWWLKNSQQWSSGLGVMENVPRKCCRNRKIQYLAWCVGFTGECVSQNSDCALSIWTFHSKFYLKNYKS